MSLINECFDTSDRNSGWTIQRMVETPPAGMLSPPRLVPYMEQPYRRVTGTTLVQVEAAACGPVDTSIGRTVHDEISIESSSNKELEKVDDLRLSDEVDCQRGSFGVDVSEYMDFVDSEGGVNCEDTFIDQGFIADKSEVDDYSRIDQKCGHFDASLASRNEHGTRSRTQKAAYAKLMNKESSHLAEPLNKARQKSSVKTTAVQKIATSSKKMANSAKTRKSGITKSIPNSKHAKTGRQRADPKPVSKPGRSGSHVITAPRVRRPKTKAFVTLDQEGTQTRRSIVKIRVDQGVTTNQRQNSVATPFKYTGPKAKLMQALEYLFVPSKGNPMVLVLPPTTTKGDFNCKYCDGHFSYSIGVVNHLQLERCPGWSFKTGDLRSEGEKRTRSCKRRSSTFATVSSVPDSDERPPLISNSASKRQHVPSKVCEKRVVCRRARSEKRNDSIDAGTDSNEIRELATVSTQPSSAFEAYSTSSPIIELVGLDGHVVKNYWCNFCSSRFFAAEDDLTAHKTTECERRHRFSKTHLFECCFCPQCFVRKDLIRDHLRDEHQIHAA